jgi:RNA polymerase sigma-70 factor, ECF subfamily
MAVTVHRELEAVWRIESARIIAGLMRVTRDLGMAEEAAQEALAAALEAWAVDGLPESPGAWLATAARRRAIDRIRRQRVERRVLQETALRVGAADVEDVDEVDARLDGSPEDDVLRLIFMACHPALAEDARAALALRLVCGLTVPEVARAYLVGEATIAQRIVRAKKTLAESNIAFEVPSGGELPARIASVLEVIYLVFNEGYAATSGADWTRPTLCEEALRLGRMLAALMPGDQQDGEVHGLVALMEFQASRLGARTDNAGMPVLLMDQDRSRWDQVLIRRGLAALEEARRLGVGVYGLQAEIAACHARARTGSETDWKGIVSLYTQLYGLVPSPVVALNLAVAAGMAEGPEEGLRRVDDIAAHRALQGYHLLPSVRAEFLRRLGRMAEARGEFERAAALARNEPERQLLLRRAGECGQD